MLRFVIFFAILKLVHASSCPEGYDLVSEGQCRGLASETYLTYNQAAKIAVSECDKVLAQPVIIHNDEQQDYWSALAPNPDFRTFLVLGIVCNTTSKHYEWADGSKIDYKPKAGWSGEMERKCTTDYSWVIRPDGSWTDGGFGDGIVASIYCTKQLEKSPQGADGCDAFEDDAEDGICYQVGATAETWQEAQMNCQKLGANLATIHNKNENAFIRRLAVSKGAVNGVFIGASAQKDGTFGWIDGSAMDYENYLPGFPKKNLGDCVVMDTSTSAGQWMNTDCAAKLPVACVRPQSSGFEPICTGEDYPEDVLITTPGFPFSASTPCDYFLTVDAGKRVQVEINLLEANSCCDSLILYEGYVGENVIAKLSGAKSSVTFNTTTSNVMRVSWQPNGGVNVKGVAMTYWAM